MFLLYYTTLTTLMSPILFINKNAKKCGIVTNSELLNPKIIIIPKYKYDDDENIYNIKCQERFALSAMISFESTDCVGNMEE